MTLIKGRVKQLYFAVLKSPCNSAICTYSKMAASVISTKVFSGSALNAGQRIAKFTHRNGFLNFNNAKTIRFYSEKSDKPVSTNESCNINAAPSYRHVPSNFDKFILVWTKKYPSKKDIPEHVTRETMDKAKSKARIYTNLLMGAFTIVGCIVMIISGKKAAKRGESVVKMNEEFHKNYNEKN